MLTASVVSEGITAASATHSTRLGITGARGTKALTTLAADSNESCDKCA